MERGFIHLKRNDRSRARAMLVQALAAAPERPDVLAALAKVKALDGDYAAAAASSHGRFFLRPSAAAEFLRVEKT
jgi:Tfp pilus assembly protein PilF